MRAIGNKTHEESGRNVFNEGYWKQISRRKRRNVFNEGYSEQISRENDIKSLSFIILLKHYCTKIQKITLT
ncbi:hypothetical protein CHR53_06120 [Neobacillus mesonae]|uniref:Uncharacterized protein n=1 Tax=Neobacillus mesonae TaxID=1193713 RepID=A0A3Q9QSY8_9BACI|nr:hypothetical protein CHR53_06120 [Neobacillus mesonae]